MFQFLKDVVAGSVAGVKDLPYNIGEPYSSAWGSWTHSRGTSKVDGSPVSIFSLTGSNAGDGRLSAARNGVKRLRTVRHPNILSFLHSTEDEVYDGSSTKVTIYIVTEPVMPLSSKIEELGLQGTQRDEYYAWGLYRIVKAVSFLNNDCGLVHGNVCLESVVVTESLDWKLHAFDVLSEFDGNNEASSGPMLQFDWLIGTQYKPEELAKSEWTVIRKSPPWAIDTYGLGCLIYEIFSGSKLNKSTELQNNTTSIPKSLIQYYQHLVNPSPSKRLNPSKLVEKCGYFQNKLVATIHFMEILNLKDSNEKDTFFWKLPTLSDQLPREIVVKKLLPLLGSALKFGSATAPALTPFLKIGSWLSPEEFNIKVVPTLVKLFGSNDRNIRLGLLQNIDQFGESFTAQIVDEQVYPHIATGFSDTSANLRELTLKSMLVLAPKLSQRTISGSLLKHLSKLQVDEEAAIRTNTTILLGNLATHLNEGTRKRVLINAFTVRALRDTFPPARGAGVMALCATSSYYDVQEIAVRILPNLVVLTIDPDSDVRSKAFVAVDQFVQIVKQYHEKVKNGDNTDHASSGLQGNSSILGWAMGSLSLGGKASEQTPHLSASSSAPNISNIPNATSSVVADVQSVTMVRARSTADIVDQPAPVSPMTMSINGWGAVENGEESNEKDGWDDFVPLEQHPNPSPSLASIQAAQKRPVAPTKPQVPNMRQKNVIRNEDLWGSTSTSTSSQYPPKSAAAISKKPIEDDDPWAAIAALPPTTRVKPLAASGRGRGGSKPKLGAQRINTTSSSGVS